MVDSDFFIHGAPQKAARVALLSSLFYLLSLIVQSLIQGDIITFILSLLSVVLWGPIYLSLWQGDLLGPDGFTTGGCSGKGFFG